MSRKTDPVSGAPWGDSDREHLIRIGLSMTPAERLQWLEDTVEELMPWVGLALQERGTGCGYIHRDAERPATRRSLGTASSERRSRGSTARTAPGLLKR